MKLDEYLSEAISRRGNSRIMEFPEDNTDKEGIINWLEMNGFHRIDNKTTNKYNSIRELIQHYYKSTGKDGYAVGDYIPGNKVTRWIRVLKKGKVYFIRTIPESQIPMDCTSHTVHDDAGNISFIDAHHERPITYKEIRDELTE